MSPPNQKGLTGNMNVDDEEVELLEKEPAGVSSAAHKVKRFVEVKKTITFKVNHFDKIDHVKDRFLKVQSVESDMQNGFFTEETFQNNQILFCRREDRSSYVQMMLNLGNRIDIGVNVFWSGKIIIVTVDGWDKMSDIKRWLLENEEEPLADEVALIHDGKQLEDSETVSDCGLENDSVLHAFVIGEDKFRLSVKMPGQETIHVKARFSLSVGTLKNLIYVMTGIKSKDQKLTFSGVLLEDKGILADYSIMKESVLDLAFTSPGLMKIFVDSPDGKRRTFYVDKTYTIINLKEDYEYIVGTPMSKQMIHFKGKPVQDDVTFAKNKIMEKDTLVMLHNISRST